MTDGQDRFFGAQEAARFLGIHRSTLHAAIQKRLLIPDSWTPGGHARFRRDTLEAFRDRMVFSAATGEEGVVAPVRTLGTIARLVIEGRDLADVGAAAIAGIRHALPQIDLCGMFRLAPTPQDRFTLKSVAHYGIERDVMESFRRLRTTFKFATTMALRTLEPEVCNDTASHPIHTGTARIARIWPIGSYAVVPIVAGSEGLGVLICVNHQPRHFSAGDLAFLQGIATILALALAGSQEQRRRLTSVATSRALIQEAQTLHMMRAAHTQLRTWNEAPSDSAHEPDDADPFSPAQAARTMADVFLRESGAAQLAILHFPVDLPTNDPQLRLLAARALAGEALVSEQWCEGSTVYTGIAISVPLAQQDQQDRVGAIVAVWAESRPNPEQDEALLLAFASAYLLAIGDLTPYPLSHEERGR
jgi:excisionase family DNA binding protein